MDDDSSGHLQSRWHHQHTRSPPSAWPPQPPPPIAPSESSNAAVAYSGRPRDTVSPPPADRPTHWSNTPVQRPPASDRRRPSSPDTLEGRLAEASLPSPPSSSVYARGERRMSPTDGRFSSRIPPGPPTHPPPFPESVSHSHREQQQQQQQQSSSYGGQPARRGAYYDEDQSREPAAAPPWDLPRPSVDRVPPPPPPRPALANYVSSEYRSSPPRDHTKTTSSDSGSEALWVFESQRQPVNYVREPPPQPPPALHQSRSHPTETPYPVEDGRDMDRLRSEDPSALSVAWGRQRQPLPPQDSYAYQTPNAASRPPPPPLPPPPPPPSSLVASTSDPYERVAVDRAEHPSPLGPVDRRRSSGPFHHSQRPPPPGPPPPPPPSLLSKSAARPALAPDHSYGHAHAHDHEHRERSGAHAPPLPQPGPPPVPPSRMRANAEHERHPHARYASPPPSSDRDTNGRAHRRDDRGRGPDPDVRRRMDVMDEPVEDKRRRRFDDDARPRRRLDDDDDDGDDENDGGGGRSRRNPSNGTGWGRRRDTSFRDDGRRGADRREGRWDDRDRPGTHRRDPSPPPPPPPPRKGKDVDRADDWGNHRPPMRGPRGRFDRRDEGVSRSWRDDEPPRRGPLTGRDGDDRRGPWRDIEADRPQRGRRAGRRRSPSPAYSRFSSRSPSPFSGLESVLSRSPRSPPPPPPSSSRRGPGAEGISSRKRPRDSLSPPVDRYHRPPPSRGRPVDERRRRSPSVESYTSVRSKQSPPRRRREPSPPPRPRDGQRGGGGWSTRRAPPPRGAPTGGRRDPYLDDRHGKDDIPHPPPKMRQWGPGHGPTRARPRSRSPLPPSAKGVRSDHGWGTRARRPPPSPMDADMDEDFADDVGDRWSRRPVNRERRARDRRGPPPSPPPRRIRRNASYDSLRTSPSSFDSRSPRSPLSRSPRSLSRSLSLQPRRPPSNKDVRMRSPSPPPVREPAPGPSDLRKAPSERGDRDASSMDGQAVPPAPAQTTDEPTVAPSSTVAPPPPPGEVYERLVQVGEGTYGKVYKARDNATGGLVALKRIKVEAEKDGFPVTAMREIKLLQTLRHENVVRLHEMMVSKGSVYMVFEYMDHDLTGVLTHPHINFSSAHLKSLIAQLLEGLAYLHKKGVLHRDIKTSNILLNNQGVLKLADFGLARFYYKRRESDYTNRVITLWYRPPELLLGATVYGPEVDMWGAGCIFLELFTRRPIFQGNDEIHQLEALFNILGTPRANAIGDEGEAQQGREREDEDPTYWPGVTDLPWYELVKPKEQKPNRFEHSFSRFLPPSGINLAQALLAHNPAKRPSAERALRHAYFCEEPLPERPAGLLSAVQGDWHEYESKKAKEKRRSKHGAVPPSQDAPDPSAVDVDVSATHA